MYPYTGQKGIFFPQCLGFSNLKLYIITLKSAMFKKKNNV